MLLSSCSSSLRDRVPALMVASSRVSFAPAPARHERESARSFISKTSTRTTRSVRVTHRPPPHLNQYRAALVLLGFTLGWLLSYALLVAPPASPPPRHMSAVWPLQQRISERRSTPSPAVRNERKLCLRLALPTQQHTKNEQTRKRYERRARKRRAATATLGGPQSVLLDMPGVSRDSQHRSPRSDLHSRP